jgi:hypothetical protein
MRGARYEGKEGPPLLQALAEAWGLTPVERSALWKALCYACWTDTVALREQLIAFTPTDREAAHTFLRDVLTPDAAVQCLERLVKERVLTRQLATRVEERLLHHTGPDGAWQPQAAPVGETHTQITITV